MSTELNVLLTQFLKQLVRRERQIPDALAGRVEHRVGDRRRDADDAEFADAFDAEAIDDFVFFGQKMNPDFADVRVDRDVIIGKGSGRVTAVAFVQDGFLR